MNAEKTSGQISVAEFLEISDRYLDLGSNLDIKCLSAFVVGAKEKGEPFTWTGGKVADDPNKHIQGIKEAIREQKDQVEDGDFDKLNLNLTVEEITPQDRLKCAHRLFDVINKIAPDNSKFKELYQSNNLFRASMTSNKLWGNPDGDLTKMIDKLNQGNTGWIQDPENKKLFIELIEKSKKAEKMPELGLLQEKITNLPPEVSEIYGPGESNSSQEEQIKACTDALIQLQSDHPNNRYVSLEREDILSKFNRGDKTTMDIVRLQIETAQLQHKVKSSWEKIKAKTRALRDVSSSEPNINTIDASAKETSEQIKDKEKNLTFFEQIYRTLGGHHQELSDLSKELEGHANQLHKIIQAQQKKNEQRPGTRPTILGNRRRG